MDSKRPPVIPLVGAGFGNVGLLVLAGHGGGGAASGRRKRPRAAAGVSGAPAQARRRSVSEVHQGTAGCSPVAEVTKGPDWALGGLRRRRRRRSQRPGPPARGRIPEDTC